MEGDLAVALHLEKDFLSVIYLVCIVHRTSRSVSTKDIFVVMYNGFKWKDYGCCRFILITSYICCLYTFPNL